MTSFSDAEFVILDVETTGLSPRYGHRLIEVAAIKIRNLKPVETFHSLVNPQRDVPFAAFLVNGISPDLLRDAPPADEILPEFFSFLGKESFWVGHNIKFDLGFLEYEASSASLDFSPGKNVLCTVKIAKALLPDLRRYPLWYVAETLGIEGAQEHRALSDCEMTFQVFLRLIQIAQRKDVYDLNALLTLFGQIKAQNLIDIKEKVNAFERAISFQKGLKLVYFSSSQGGVTFRAVRPLRIVKEKGKVCLQAFCHLRNEERLFRLDRIMEWEEKEAA